MGSPWDLICNEAELVAWMKRHRVKNASYTPPNEWSYPFLIGFIVDGWEIVDVADARRLVEAAGAAGLGVGQ